MTDHARQLLEKHFRKPFLNLQYAAGLERMDISTVQEGIAWLDDCFHIIRHQDDVMPSVEWILDLARAAVLRSPPPHRRLTTTSTCFRSSIVCVDTGCPHVLHAWDHLC